MKKILFLLFCTIPFFHAFAEFPIADDVGVYGRLCFRDSSGSTVYCLPESDGTSGQTIQTDGTGTLSWSDMSGDSSISDGDIAKWNSTVLGGVEWEPQTAPDDMWFDVTYGNGKYVAVGYITNGGYNVMSSSDAVTWNPATTYNSVWRSVTYGNGLFVAVGISISGSPNIMTSPDGVNWTSRTAPEANSWRAVTYGNGIFVAVAASGTNRIMTSEDGITWNPIAAPEANGWTDIAYGNGLFVAVSGNGTNRIMTSSNGVTWTAVTAPVASTWRAVTYGNGIFVATATSGTHQVMTSADGTTWQSYPTPTGNWHTVAYGDGIFMALSGDELSKCMISLDGQNWRDYPTITPESAYGLVYGEDEFVAVLQVASPSVMTSSGVSNKELDTIFSASPASDIAVTDINNWNTAFGWGNHADSGYLTNVNSNGQIQFTTTGSPIAAGTQAWARVPQNFTITSVEITCTPSATAVVDIWVDSRANFPPTDADSITASATPTVIAGQMAYDETLMGWDTTINAGDYILFNVDANDNATSIVVTLIGTKS